MKSTLGFQIRTEFSGDSVAITVVIDAAFQGKPYAEGDESELVLRLRELGDVALSLVATVSDEVVGQAVFTIAKLEGESGHWYALGPIAVMPSYQGKGVGSALVRAGFRHLLEIGAFGCILVGDPNFYRRFGFELSPENCPDDQPKEYFMVKLLGDVAPVGKFSFHPAFGSHD